MKSKYFYKSISIILATLFIFIFSEINIMAKSKYSEEGYTFTSKRYHYKTEVGSLEFVISNKYQKIFSTYYNTLEGHVTNNTNKDWINLKFHFIVTDSTGNEIKKYGSRVVGEILSKNLKAGETNNILGFMEQTDFPIIYYKLEMIKGTHPKEYVFGMVKPIIQNDLKYQDDSIEIEFTLDEKKMGIHLTNKTDEPISVIWDQTSYVDVTAKAHKVIHSGVKFVDKEKNILPTLIPPGARIEDIIYPSDYIDYYDGDWQEKPLLPFGKEADLYIGKKISVLIPIEIKGKRKNYYFSFIIKEVKDKRI